MKASTSAALLAPVPLLIAMTLAVPDYTRQHYRPITPRPKTMTP